MKLSKWVEVSGIFPTYATTEKGAVSVICPDLYGDAHKDLFHLEDYKVDGVYGSVVWLVPIGKVQMDTRSFYQGSKDVAHHLQKGKESFTAPQQPEEIATQRIRYAIARIQDGDTLEKDILYYSGCIAEAIKNLPE